MHPRYRHDVHESSPGHGHKQRIVLIEIALVPQHQRLHKGGGISGKDAVPHRGDRVIQPGGASAQIKAAIGENDLALRAAGQINVPGKINRIIFAVALISPSELGGAADLIPRLGVCKNSAVVIEQHPHMRQPFPGQHKLYPGGIVIDLRVVRDAAFDLQALPIQLEGRLQRCLRMDKITQAAESASKKEQRKSKQPLLFPKQNKQPQQ